MSDNPYRYLKTRDGEYVWVQLTDDLVNKKAGCRNLRDIVTHRKFCKRCGERLDANNWVPDFGNYCDSCYGER